MDKQVVAHIHNGRLLSYKKKHIWVSSNGEDEPGAYYRVKSEKERQILYINTYISEKALAPHSSTAAWKIPWEEPGRLQATGSHRVWHNWSDLAAAAMHIYTYGI